ncbi:MAG: sensor histidine kinase [Acidobacteriaceae bacterium]|nr:sensor histidine kinase [Acidobacteriaceae bacterium]
MCSTKAVWIQRMLLASILVSLAVPILEWGFNAQMSWRQLGVDYLVAMVYALSIGSMLTLLLSGTWVALSRLNTGLRWTIRAALIVAGTALGCLAAGLVLLAVYGRNYAYWTCFVGSFRIGVVLSVFCVALLTMYERYKTQMRITETQLKAKELERERALKLATEARLSSLESRIHPHFLFNTINSVSSLIHDEPQRAERMLNQMADLLRFSLDSAQRGLVRLERELRIVEDYLEIEKARFGDRLRYEIVVPDAVLQAAVPPLSLQTLVENSVKYAVSPRRQGATIEIFARASGGLLILQVRDDGPGFPNTALPAGHGLNNLQERLTTLFGPKGSVNVTSEGSGALVTIQMPFVTESQKPAPAHPVESNDAAVRL